MRTLFWWLWLAVAVAGTSTADEIGAPLYFGSTDEVVPPVLRRVSLKENAP